MGRQFAKKKLVFVPQIVQVELVWVLQAVYGLDKTEILPVLQHLQVNESFQLQNEHEFSAALQLYQSNNVDFSDSLIFVESKKENCDVVTFDIKLSRMSNVKHLAD